MGQRLASDPRLQELEKVYREHHRRVRWVLRGRGVGDDALDDLVHDVFVAAFRRLDDRDPAVPMSTWVAGVARNIAFSHRRASARRMAAAHRMPEPEASVGPDEEIARGQAWRELQAFLAGLDDDQREVFVLAECLGMRVPEVANIVDAPLNTLYSRLRIARRRFGDRFGPQAQEQLRRASAAERPTPSQRQHAWMAISATLVPKAGPLAVAASGVASKWLLAGGITVATIGAGLGLRAVVRDVMPDAAHARATTTDPQPPKVTHPDASAPRHDGSDAVPTSQDNALAGVAEPSGVSAVDPRTSPPTRSSSETPAAADAPPTATGSAATTPPIATDAASARSRRTAPSAGARAEQPGPAPEPSAATDPLGEVVDALRIAQRRLRAGDAAEALRVLDAISPRAAGFMARERRRIEQDAACAAGDLRRAGRAQTALAGLGEAVSGPPCKKVATP